MTYLYKQLSTQLEYIHLVSVWYANHYYIHLSSLVSNTSAINNSMITIKTDL